MNDSVRSNIRNVLKSLRSMLESGSVIASELKRLSNAMVEDISLFHDQDSISVAVLVYALYKVFSRNADLERSQLLALVRQALKSVDNDIALRRSIKLLFDQIKKYDKNIDADILQIIEHAQIKKGVKVYEQGISIGHAAEIIGISKWDLMDYLGSSDVIERDPAVRVDQKARLSYARALFK